MPNTDTVCATLEMYQVTACLLCARFTHGPVLCPWCRLCTGRAGGICKKLITLSPSMVTDHTFGFYQTALDEAVSAVGGDAKHRRAPSIGEAKAM